MPSLYNTFLWNSALYNAGPTPPSPPPAPTPGPVYNTTLATLSDAVYARLDGNRLFYAPSQVRDAINEAVFLCNLFCGWINITVPVYNGGTTISNRVIYRVPDSIVLPEKVSFEGGELDKSSFNVLNRNWPDWMKDTTASTGGEVTRWCPYALNRFILHPADSAGGGYMEVTGVANPTVLVNDGDISLIPRSGVSVVVEYAAHAVQSKLGAVPLVQSMPMYRTYESLIKQHKIWQTYKQPNFWLDIKLPE